MANEPSRDLIGSTMSCRRIDDLLIVVHQRHLLPSDTDWQNYVHWCKALLEKYPSLKVLVVAGEKPPTASHRSYYNQEIPGDRVRIAVLITGRHVLVIVKVFAWFVRSIEAFDSKDLRGALKYLGVASTPAIDDTIRDLVSAPPKTTAVSP
jgi:hypothetical protein